MIIGFTGSRNGMTPEQYHALNELIKGASELHHGECLGSDEYAHGLAIEQAIPVIIHPPSVDTYRAICSGAQEVKEEKPYLDRNKDIVDACDLLIATPAEATEQLRSGTWSTVRYAVRKGKPVKVINPDGTVTER